VSHASLKSLAGENHLVIRGSRIKLTIIARSSDDFGVVVNSEERHKTKQSIFKVNVTDADLHELTESRVDKDHLVEFAFTFLLESEPVDDIQSAFNIKIISQYFPEFPEAVQNWIDENAE
jgi:hypothetical protein